MSIDLLNWIKVRPRDLFGRFLVQELIESIVWTSCLLRVTDQGERPPVTDDKRKPVLLYSLNVWWVPGCGMRIIGLRSTFRLIVEHMGWWKYVLVHLRTALVVRQLEIPASILFHLKLILFRRYSQTPSTDKPVRKLKGLWENYILQWALLRLKSPFLHDF